MQLCSVFSKSPVNVLSYFHNLKNKKKKGTHRLQDKGHCSLWNRKEESPLCTSLSRLQANKFKI